MLQTTRNDQHLNNINSGLCLTKRGNAEDKDDLRQIIKKTVDS